MNGLNNFFRTHRNCPTVLMTIDQFKIQTIKIDFFFGFNRATEKIEVALIHSLWNVSSYLLSIFVVIQTNLWFENVIVVV